MEDGRKDESRRFTDREVALVLKRASEIDLAIGADVAAGIAAGFAAGRFAWDRVSAGSRARVERLAAELAQTARDAAGHDPERETDG